VKIDTVEAVVRSHVTEIVPAVDPRSRSFLVRVTLPASLALQPGMFGRLRFRCESRRIIAVPVEAILRRGQLDVVYVVRDGRVHLRLIRRGRTFGTVVRNSIILVDFIELRLAEGMPLAEAVVDAGAVRFRPMLLTALAVAVGASVILFDPIFQGLAISLMAGEVASLLLSRMAVPVLYLMSAGGQRPAPPQAG
jgi:hypothetical protein